MSYQKLELHISQVEKAINKCRSTFNSPKKAEIYKELIVLFNKVKQSKYREYDKEAIAWAKAALDIVFHGVMFLDYSSSSEIPKHLIFCLNTVLDEWITQGSENYFVVISHNKSSHDFAIRAMDEAQMVKCNLYFEELFALNHRQSLIQISKPKFLFDDYLASVPVYHEMGHFIDKNYQIVRNLFLRTTFKPDKVNGERKEMVNHYSEHFSDIFAAQYIGRSAIEPLTYISNNDKKSTFTHPSNAKRIEVVDAFLSGTGSAEAMEIVNDLKAITQERVSRELKIRNQKLAQDPFQTLKPYKVSSLDQLHTLFLLGWENWLNEDSNIRKRFPDSMICCQKINKIIKDTIELSMPPVPFYQPLKDLPLTLVAQVKKYKSFVN